MLALLVAQKVTWKTVSVWKFLGRIVLAALLWICDCERKSLRQLPERAIFRPWLASSRSKRVELFCHAWIHCELA
jgi:hypothetical protein